MIARDFKWLGSYRYGIIHLGGKDEADLRAQCEGACGLLGWPAPYAELSQAHTNPTSTAAAHRPPPAPRAPTDHSSNQPTTT
ncbi:MAG: hypothetical protein ABI589_11590 [Burkholderiales bacterium]